MAGSLACSHPDDLPHKSDGKPVYGVFLLLTTPADLGLTRTAGRSPLHADFGECKEVEKVFQRLLSAFQSPCNYVGETWRNLNRRKSLAVCSRVSKHHSRSLVCQDIIGHPAAAEPFAKGCLDKTCFVSEWLCFFYLLGLITNRDHTPTTL